MLVRAHTPDGPMVQEVRAMVICSNDGTPFLAVADIDGATVSCMAGEPEFAEVCRFAGLEVPDIRQVRQ